MGTGRIRIAPTSWVAAGALVFFAGAACLFIPKIGIEPDEVLFVPPLYHYAPFGSVKIFGHRVPTMLMSYVGADKTYLYAPILKALPPTTWSLRLPVVFIGLLSLWLLFAATRRLTNDLVAVALVCLIATDPMFLLTTTFDWGPVALQHLFIIAALFFLAREKPMIFTGFLLLGLALWDKGTAVWSLAGLFISVAVFLPDAVKANASIGNAAKALCGFALGALPFLRYNIRNHWATISNVNFSAAGLPAKFRAMWVTLNGRGMFGWFVRGGDPSWYSLVPFGVAAAIVLLFHRKVAEVRRLALFALSAGLLTWIGMLVATDGGASVHHIILVWPWPHLFAVCVLGYALGRKAFAAAAIAMVLSNIVMIGWYAQRTYEFGPSLTWSDGTFALPGLIPAQQPGARKIIATEWAIDLPTIFLSRGKPLIEMRSLADLARPDFAGDMGRLEGTEFLSYAPEAELHPEDSAKFDAAIAKLGFTRVVDRVIVDRSGRSYAMSFHCERAAP